jgi:hypothetical protein
MVTEFESEEEAKAYACKLLGIPEALDKPRKVIYGFPIDRTLEVYELTKEGRKLSFGVGWRRSGRGKVFYGLWLIEGEDVKQV